VPLICVSDHLPLSDLSTYLDGSNLGGWGKRFDAEQHDVDKEVRLFRRAIVHHIVVGAVLLDGAHPDRTYGRIQSLVSLESIYGHDRRAWIGLALGVICNGRLVFGGDWLAFPERVGELLLEFVRSALNGSP
jgi:hypothetical protein